MTISKKTKAADRRIYIGPALSGHRLAPYSVWIGGLPPQVKDLAAANPWLEKLFVPVADMREKMAEAARQGTPLHLYYEKAKEV